MISNYSNKTSVISSIHFFDLIRRSLVLFTLLLSVFSFAAEQNENRLSENDQSVVLSNNVENFSRIPFHPTSPNPVPESPADSDDKEEKDGLDDDLKIASKSFILSGIAKNKILYALLFQSFQNRISISLVILYQSWKSFFI